MTSGQRDGYQGGSSAVLDPTMSLVGRLEDLSLGEILQIVSLSKRSGLLSLESPGRSASLYIRSGKVIYAASSDEKEGVLAILADKRLIDQEQLQSLDKELDSVPSTPDFLRMLNEKTGIGHQRLQEVLKTRVEELAFNLFMWEEGTFSFQLIEDESTHPLLSKVAPFFLEEGIGAQFLVMEGARRRDEMMRDAPGGAPGDKSPMVDTEKVLGADWEDEFEQHLAGSAGGGQEEASEGGLAEELAQGLHLVLRLDFLHVVEVGRIKKLSAIDEQVHLGLGLDDLLDAGRLFALPVRAGE